MYGKGLDSIRVRFTLMMGALVAAGAALMLALDATAHLDDASAAAKVVIVLAVTAIPAGAAYLMAGRLVRPIEELRRSTEAIAAGSTDILIEVDCTCEVGGLADAFRRMVARLNSNIMRMNVLAYSDAVTRLPNRAALNQVLGHAMDPAQPPFVATVFFIDLDNFKKVNDTLGHEAGDALLRMAADRILRRAFGKSIETLDTCMSPTGDSCVYAPTEVMMARFAGDEFVAVVPGPATPARAEDIARTIIGALAEPFLVGGTAVSVGASVGIARTPDDATDPRELLSYSDLAMYAAKRGGRNRFASFDARLRAEARNRMTAEAELRRALDEDGLFLEFQPKIRVADLSVIGVEALVRMRGADGRVVPPSDFIPIAESCGLIERVGDVVLAKAVAQAAAWKAAGRPMPISVNASAIQFARPGFAESVLDLVLRGGLEADLLEVELTESAAMLDVAATRRRLGVLKAGGIRIAIDDFGTGFSNLSQLIRLPLDDLKIDRSLVALIGSDARGEALLAGAFAMARELGHATVAEGVETQRQFAFLERHGCTAVQGFLFAVPMGAADLEAWLERRHGAPDTGRGRLLRALGGEPVGG